MEPEHSFRRAPPAHRSLRRRAIGQRHLHQLAFGEVGKRSTVRRPERQRCALGSCNRLRVEIEIGDVERRWRPRQ